MRLVRPPIEALRRTLRAHPEQGTNNALDVYCSPVTLLREFFWLRLVLLLWLIDRHAGERDSCLDFGGGSGILAPSLVRMFRQVSLIDINTLNATALCDELAIANLTIHTEDATRFEFPDTGFDVIVAADVLEHFADLSAPVERIMRWLRPDGVLFTSLPTENLMYRCCRVVFRQQKPPDHYHAAHQVEAFLTQAGFRKIAGLSHPLIVPLLPLFRISAWRKQPGA
jgi:2-polyprenyl-3-methyl-5-hydroxy-6-metoxy-1,4-benzoquinol methylase